MLRRVIYLDRSLAVAHVALGTIQQRLGRAVEARRSFRNAFLIARALPPDEMLAFGEGGNAGELVRTLQADFDFPGEFAGASP